MVFTRHRNLRTQGVPQGIRSHSEYQYDAVLDSFDHQTVAHGLTAGFASARPQSMWWKMAAQSQSPDIELLLQVEQYCLCAGDPTMPAEVKWKLRASLTGLGSKRVYWRDCMDWTIPLDSVSMDDLNRADPDDRAGKLKEVLDRLAGRLAEHLAGQR